MNASAPLPAMPLYTAAETRELDRLAVAHGDIDGVGLMERAGASAFRRLQSHWRDAQRLLVVCGTGNNGGDGWVVARLALAAGLDVRVVLVGDPAKIANEAKVALDAYVATEMGFEVWDPAGPLRVNGIDLVVDALLGTGFTGRLRSDTQQLIEQINAFHLPVLALDCPSGLRADTGMPGPVAIHATQTISFIGRNRGLYTGRGPEFVGECLFDDLGTGELCAGRLASAFLMDLDSHLDLLPRRIATSHKGHFGHVLIVGGNEGMGGAAILAAEAALRAGAGLVSLASHVATVSASLSRRPEIMARAVIDRPALRKLLGSIDVVVIGPGLGQDRWGQDMLGEVLDSGLPTVFDADALNLLAGMPGQALPERALLTPHPGEAARLLSISTTAVNEDRFAALSALTKTYRAHVILKGAGTLVGGPSRTDVTGVCPYGNPGMASGGMGDVLAGLTGALIGQGMAVGHAAALGVCLHGRGADVAVQGLGQQGLLASDVIDTLPGLFL